MVPRAAGVPQTQVCVSPPVLGWLPCAGGAEWGGPGWFTHDCAGATAPGVLCPPLLSPIIADILSLIGDLSIS